MTALTITIPQRCGAQTRFERLLVGTAELLLTLAAARARTRAARVLEAQDAMAEAHRDGAAVTASRLLPR